MPLLGAAWFALSPAVSLGTLAIGVRLASLIMRDLDAADHEAESRGEPVQVEAVSNAEGERGRLRSIRVVHLTVRSDASRNEFALISQCKRERPPSRQLRTPQPRRKRLPRAVVLNATKGAGEMLSGRHRSTGLSCTFPS